MADPLEVVYSKHCSQVKRAMTAHLPRLRALAQGCELAQEFGVKQGASSTALLLGAKHVISYDILATPQAQELQRLAGARWEYRIQDSRTAPVTPCDLLLVDSLHTYAQCQAELRRHAASVRRWLICHDTITFGSIGANGETGAWSWTPQPGVSVPLAHMGIRPAIDELLIADPTWRIAAHYIDSHGLLVLRREAH